MSGDSRIGNTGPPPIDPSRAEVHSSSFSTLASSGFSPANTPSSKGGPHETDVREQVSGFSLDTASGQTTGVDGRSTSSRRSRSRGSEKSDTPKSVDSSSTEKFLSSIDNNSIGKKIGRAWSSVKNAMRKHPIRTGLVMLAATAAFVTAEVLTLGAATPALAAIIGYGVGALASAATGIGVCAWAKPSSEEKRTKQLKNFDNMIKQYSTMPDMKSMSNDEKLAEMDRYREIYEGVHAQMTELPDGNEGKAAFMKEYNSEESFSMQDHQEEIHEGLKTLRDHYAASSRKHLAGLHEDDLKKLK